jgi:hypothetical protein
LLLLSIYILRKLLAKNIRLRKLAFYNIFPIVIVVIIAVIVFFIILSANANYIFDNLILNKDLPAEPFENKIVLDNKSVKSPNSNKSVILRTDQNTYAPELFYETGNKTIDKNVYHLEWSSDSKYVYYTKIGDNGPVINRFNTEDNSTEILLTRSNTKKLGFVLLKYSIIYTTDLDVGFLNQDGTNHLGIDDIYVPNIIPDQDLNAATVEINLVEKVRYLIIDNAGNLINDIQQ